MVSFPIVRDTSVDCMVGVRVVVVRRVRSRLDGQSRVGGERGGKMGIGWDGERDVIVGISKRGGNSDGKNGGRGVKLVGGSDGVRGDGRDSGRDVVVGIVLSMV